MSVLLWMIAVVGVVWSLMYLRAPLFIWTAVAAAALAAYSMVYAPSIVSLVSMWIAFFIIAFPLNFPPLRRKLVSDYALRAFREVMPTMSDTEREALEAGTVWWGAELFSGRPSWKRLLNIEAPALTPEEQAFLDGPVEELCRLLDDWNITHERRDLSPEAWRYIKNKGFFGMIIPKKYSGLEFSAQAHSAVIMKIASRSVTGAVTVMVPNSLGPAELLLNYGTEDQKNYYLPRLARGEEVPCFALTGPEAGSDASSMPDQGIVCRGEFQGKQDILGIRLNWEKRYITLGPVATVLGLAFKLYDPDRLLGDREELGITLALIPTDTPGITIGNRHNPLNISFQNGPNSGKDVFIPMDWIIGGADYIGQGWRMLMESLAAGRSISLPALSTGAGKLACRATGAYARIRKQFKLPIGKFEGVEEVLARMAGYTYLMDAARTMTVSAVDLGERPSVASAIVKYHLTERMRRVVNDAMDVQGGSGICLGPHNFIGRAYQSLPISITVEGANILTRTLIIYGQGAIRCHPYVLKEMQAVADDDLARASKIFDKAIFGHVGFVISNAARALWLGLTNARFVWVPVTGPARRYCQHLTRLSSAFTFVSDMAMFILGGSLKRREKLSGRLADVLSYLYLASAVVKRFEDQGRPAADVALLAWACDDALHRIQQGLDGLLKNFPNRWAAWFMRRLVFPLGRYYHAPDDAMGHEAAAILLTPSAARDRLTAGIFIPKETTEAIGRLEDALPKVIAAEVHERKLQAVAYAHPILSGDHEALLQEGLRQGVLDAREAEVVRAAHAARRAVIQVDDFTAEAF